MYPKVYRQMKKMIEACERNRDKVQDQSYLNDLVAELEMRCLELELEVSEWAIEAASLEEVRYDIDCEVAA